MFVPVLHLTAHGIELFLKANLVHAGVSLKDLKDGFGHDITRLWEDERNGLLRSSARQSATDAWNDARRSGKWPDSFEGDAFEVFVNNLKALADLHSQGTEKGYPFQLRYLAPVGAEGPRPNQLLDVFLPLCDQCLRLASGI